MTDTLRDAANEASPTPWTWINTERPDEALALARMALSHPHCNAVILSKNAADGSFANWARAALGGSVPSPSPTQTGESPEFERGIASVLFLRCLTHRHVPQLNTTEFSGGECGACCADIALAVRASSPGPSPESQ